MIGNLSAKQIEQVLQSKILGRIACYDGCRPYVVPVNFVYDGIHIIAHAVEGMKIQMMRQHPQVCFQVDEIIDFTNWKSVVVWGEFQELVDSRDKYNAMKLFVDRTMKLKISETAIPPEISEQRVHPRSPGNIKPVIYRIIISEKSGRYETDL